MAANAPGPAALGYCKGGHNRVDDLLFCPVVGQLQEYGDGQIQR